MDSFSYLAVLISIILGLGITRLLTGLGRQIEVRERVSVYWPAIAWAVVLLLIHVQTWWSMFGMRAFGDWAFHEFLVVLLQPIALYLLAALILPDGTDDAPMNLRDHYYAQRRWFFGVFGALLVISLAKDLTLMGHLPDPVNVGFHLLFLLLSVVAVATGREWFHRFLAFAALMLFSAYIAALFPRLA